MVSEKALKDFIKRDPVADVPTILAELVVMADSLTGDLMDDVVYNTLESVIDIIIENCYVEV